MLVRLGMPAHIHAVWGDGGAEDVADDGGGVNSLCPLRRRYCQPLLHRASRYLALFAGLFSQTLMARLLLLQAATKSKILGQLITALTLRASCVLHRGEPKDVLIWVLEQLSDPFLARPLRVNHLKRLLVFVRGLAELLFRCSFFAPVPPAHYDTIPHDLLTYFLLLYKFKITGC